MKFRQKEKLKIKKLGLQFRHPARAQRPIFFTGEILEHGLGARIAGDNTYYHLLGSIFPTDPMTSLRLSPFFFLSPVLHLFFAGCVFSRFFLLFFCCCCVIFEMCAAKSFLLSFAVLVACSNLLRTLSVFPAMPLSYVICR